MKSPVFCMAPWVHLFVNPHGGILPCCVADHERPVGNLHRGSLLEAWNSPAMRALRLNMVDGRPSPECNHCYQEEAAGGARSTRHDFNERFSHHLPRVDGTAADGTVEELHLPYWDFRFSNLCNFRCRPCTPSFSSAWYDDATHLPLPWTQPATVPRVRSAANSFDELWAQLDPQVDRLEAIYFAGGEPLFMDEHAFLLRELVERKRTDVHLRYSTNLSRLSHQGVDFPSLWRQFDHVTVAISVDGSGARGEYLRKGMAWESFVANWREVKRRAPNVITIAASTVYALNVLHVPDLQRELLAGGLLDRPRAMQLNVLQGPRYLSIQVLPPSLKAEVRRRYQAHIAEVLAPFGAPDLRTPFEAVVSFMDAADGTDLLPELVRMTRLLDELRQESCLEMLPELAPLFEV